MQRVLRIDICDYNNKILCNLYDSMSDVSGGAVDVFISTERNGWKELSFTIPSTMNTEDGIEENYRLEYLIADYRLRAVTEEETDWFLISEPKIHHNAKSKNVEVTADHISRLLKTKQMNLEFSDSEGNNVGTCLQFLELILDGTSFTPGNIATFFEDDGKTEKVRSLTESAGVGAFRMITDLCDLFEAKPVFHGDRSVDILPMNPFSVEVIPIDPEGTGIPQYGYGKTIRLEDGQIPTLTDQNVLEFHYDKELKGIERILNTENLITRLYAYGSYGDATTGICDLKEINHDEHIYTLYCSPGAEYKITLKDNTTRYFTADERCVGAKLVYSTLDAASRSYIWNETNQRAYRVYEKPKTTAYGSLSHNEIQSIPNNVDFLLDFHYYDEVGLLTDDMLQGMAKYQRNIARLNGDAITAAADFADSISALSTIGEANSGFLRLKVKRYSKSNKAGIYNGNLVVEIDTSENDGILYRSDYEEKYPFAWHTAKALKENGDPTSGSPGMVWIIHKTEPATFEQAYLQLIDDRMESYTDYYGVTKEQAADYTYGVSDGRPEKITLWLNRDNVWDRLNPNTDEVYLFCTNSMSRGLGVAFSADEAAKTALENELKTGTVKHPVYFEDIRSGNTERTKPSPALDDALRAITSNPEGYGWVYQYNPNRKGWTQTIDGDLISRTPPEMGKLYFCYHKDGDNQWYRAICQETEPSLSEAIYFYNTRNKTLYRNTGTWEALDPLRSEEYKRIAEAFGVAWKYCLRRDEIYKGKHEQYIWTNNLSRALGSGNYAIVNPYGFYWTFTTDRDIPAGDKLTIDVANNHVYQDEDPAHIVETQAIQTEVIDFPEDNILTPERFSIGTLNVSTGVEENVIGDSMVRTVSIKIHDNTAYDFKLPDGSFCILSDLNNNYLSHHTLDGGRRLEVGNQVGYVRVVCPATILDENGFTGNWYVRVADYENTLFANNVRYTILNPVYGKGVNKGINNLITAYPEYANKAYLQDLKALQDAQTAIKEEENQFVDVMQDLLKETRWQEPDYVDGDEEKLYTDALDNLHQVAKPEATYNIDFLDLYRSDPLVDPEDIEWPDIQATDAVHLVDPEIGVNLWAYVDKLNKCYDKPWQTSLEINTNLSNINQHSFTDVMTRIAEVAKETKNKQTIYGRAAALSSAGQLLAEKLEGTIQANKIQISGDVSNWYTNDKGQMIFESESGLYAIMISGAGLMLANSKDSSGDWNWRTTMTGAGLTADEILFGTMSGQRIAAGSITTQQISAGVGNELEIGSNKALTLFATRDGYRPAGSLDTQDSIVPKVEEDESFIQILPAGVDSSGNAIPARVYIMSGGLLHLQGQAVAVMSDSTLDLGSGSDMSIHAGGSLSIDVSGENGNNGKFTVNSENFKINNDGDLQITGTVTAYAGNIAGFKIINKEDNGRIIGTAMYVEGGVDSISSTLTKGVYLGTDGVNIGGRLVMSQDGAVAKFGSAKMEMNAVDGSITLNGGKVGITADSTVEITSGKNLTFTTGGSVIIGNNSMPFTVGSDGTGVNSRAFIYNGKTSKNDTTHNGVYLGTDGIIIGQKLINGEGGYFQALPDGTVQMTGDIHATGGEIGGWSIGQKRLSSGSGDNYVALDSGTADVDYSIWAGKEDPAAASFSVRRDGTLYSTKGTIANWNIKATYFGSGASKNASQIGMATGTGDAIVFWAGNNNNAQANSLFRVTANGAMYSTSGKIGNWYIGEDYIGNGGQRTTSTVGMFSGTGAASFWAGGTQSGTAKFSVTPDGYLTSTSGSIGGWTIGTTLSKTIANVGAVTLGASTYAINANNLFTVGYNGYMTSTSGKIGGWKIDANNIYSDENFYFYLNSDTIANQPYAIWIGSNDPTTDNAKFRVDKYGNVWLRSVKVSTDEGWKEIDLTKNFDQAVSISGAWDGGNFKVTASFWGQVNKTASMSASISVSGATVAGGGSGGTGYYLNAVVDYSINGSVRTTTVNSIDVDASGPYEDGYIVAANYVDYDPGSTTVTVPAPTGADSTDTLDITDTYNAGWNDALKACGISGGGTVYTGTVGQAYDPTLDVYYAVVKNYTKHTVSAKS